MLTENITKTAKSQKKVQKTDNYSEIKVSLQCRKKANEIIAANRSQLANQDMSMFTQS